MEQNASVTELSLVIIKRARYNELIKKKISSGQGDRNPWKSKFPTGGIVRDPLWRLIW
jgi:hypothetical protein